MGLHHKIKPCLPTLGWIEAFLFAVKHGGGLGDPAPSLPTGDKAVLQAGIGFPELSYKLVLGRNPVFL